MVAPFITRNIDLFWVIVSKVKKVVTKKRTETKKTAAPAAKRSKGGRKTKSKTAKEKADEVAETQGKIAEACKQREAKAAQEEQLAAKDIVDRAAAAVKSSPKGKGEAKAPSPPLTPASEFAEINKVVMQFFEPNESPKARVSRDPCRFAS